LEVDGLLVVVFFGFGLRAEENEGWMVVMGVGLRGEEFGVSMEFVGEVVIGDWDMFVVWDLV
jgi:hypothetical protein